MAVVLVSAEYPPMAGGIGDYTRRLALALRQQGEPAAVLTSVRAGGLPGDPLEVLPLVRRWGWGSLLQVRRFLRRHPVEIVHLQYQAGAYRMHPAVHFLPDLLRRLPAPPRLVVTMHDLRLPYLCPKAGRLRQAVVAHLLRRADAVVVTNGADLARLTAGRGGLLVAPDGAPLLRPLPPGALRRPVALIPLGSSLPTDTPRGVGEQWRARLGVGKEPLLGHFGLLHPSKGADLLVRAVAAALPGARLLFVGGGTGASDPGNAPFAAALRAEVARLGLAERVHWTGSLPEGEAAAALRACDLVVLPFRDGASFRRSSLVAALALGCPVLTTGPSSPAEVSLGAGRPTLVDGESAALVPAGDVPALAEAISALLGDAGRRATLGEGAARLGQAFRWEEVAQKTRELYGSVAGRG